MADQAADVRDLLARAADSAGPFTLPPISELTRRHTRQSRTRARLVVLVSFVAVAAVAVGLTWGGGQRATTTRPPVKLSLPGPTGPAVSVSALRSYRWSALPTAPIEPRSYAVSVWTGQRLLVWGGQGADDSLYGDGASYDPAARTWTKLPASPLSPRGDAQSAWVAGAFIVWGGYTGGDGQRATDGARYDVATNTWTRLPTAPVTSYRWARLVVAGDRLVLLTAGPDGSGGTVEADIYDPGSNAWRRLPELPGLPSQDFFDGTVLGVADAVFLWRYWHHETSRTEGSGVEVTGTSGEDTHALDIRTGRWTSMPLLDPGQNRRSTQALWSGRQVVLPELGGYCGFCSQPASLNDPGVTIDPVTGTRTPIAGGPISNHSSDYAWTGAALLGINLSTLIGNAGPHAILSPGDTAAWDPGTHGWISLRGVDIRGNANGAVTVWTGRELLIWGMTKGPSQHSTPPAGLAFAPEGG
jgi:Galactose oxidase, central domain